MVTKMTLKQVKNPSIILKDLTLRQHSVVQATFSAYEYEYWTVTYTRGGNLRFPDAQAATYFMIRLRDTALRLRDAALRLRVSDEHNAIAADEVATKIHILVIRPFAHCPPAERPGEDIDPKVGF
jgi:hypothetical protein